jgi:hypothetical protein
MQSAKQKKSAKPTATAPAKWRGFPPEQIPLRTAFLEAGLEPVHKVRIPLHKRIVALIAKPGKGIQPAQVMATVLKAMDAAYDGFLQAYVDRFRKEHDLELMKDTWLDWIHSDAYSVIRTSMHWRTFGYIDQFMYSAKEDGPLLIAKAAGLKDYEVLNALGTRADNLCRNARADAQLLLDHVDEQKGDHECRTEALDRFPFLKYGCGTITGGAKKWGPAFKGYVAPVERTCLKWQAAERKKDTKWKRLRHYCEVLLLAVKKDWPFEKLAPHLQK